MVQLRTLCAHHRNAGQTCTDTKITMAAERAGLRSAIAAAAILCGERDEKVPVGAKSEKGELARIGRVEERCGAPGRRKNCRRASSLILRASLAFSILLLLHGPDRLSSRLQKRLCDFHTACPQYMGSEAERQSAQVEFDTGSAALWALKKVHEESDRICRAAAAESSATSAAVSEQGASSSTRNEGDALLFGVRDLQTLRTLISIVCNWALLPCVGQYDSAFAGAGARGAHSEQAEVGAQTKRFVELPSDAELQVWRGKSIRRLQTTCDRMAGLIDDFAEMVPSNAASLGQNILSDAIVTGCAPYLLALGLRLGWGPSLIGKIPVISSEGISKKATSLVSNILKL